jgi:hypothetical protein
MPASANGSGLGTHREMPVRLLNARSKVPTKVVGGEMLHEMSHAKSRRTPDLRVRLCLKIGRSAVRPRPWPPPKPHVTGPCPVVLCVPS